MRNTTTLHDESEMIVPFSPYIMTLQEFLSKKFPPVRYILQPWLADCGLMMVHAAPGVGKTYFLLAMAAAITRRYRPEDFCGWPIKRRASVLFVDGEMPSFIMQRRLRQVEAAYPDNPGSAKHPLFLLSCMDYTRKTGSVLTFSNENAREEFSEQMAEHKAKVIILDNIVSLMNTKDENDAAAWSVINRWLLKLRGMGKSVIIVHHSSKRGTQRGTSHRADNVDTILRLEEANNGRIKISFEKHRNFSRAEAASVGIEFRIDERAAVFTRVNGLDVSLSERDQKVMEMIADKKPYTEIADHFGISKGLISQIKKRMKKKETDEKEA